MSYPYTFPEVTTREHGLYAQYEKLVEEVLELQYALQYETIDNVCEELQDVMQVCEGMNRNLEEGGENMVRWHEFVIEKNRTRGYYSA